MGRVVVDGDMILLGRIEQDEPLRKRLQSLKHGDTLELDIAGTVVRWERTLVEIGGQYVDAIKPTESARPAWSRLHRGGAVDINPPAEGSRLAGFGLRLPVWDTPQNQIH